MVTEYSILLLILEVVLIVFFFDFKHNHRLITFLQKVKLMIELISEPGASGIPSLAQVKIA